MRVGIMSMQRIENYGSFLQAYGLKKIIENLGHEVEFVDYHRGPSIIESKDHSIGLNRASMLIRFIKHRSSKKKRKMYREARAYSSNYKTAIQRLGVNEKWNYTPDVDVLVIGSDEVFNCLQEGEDVGFSPELFGANRKSRTCISYAASFGTTTVERLRQYHKDSEIAEYLNDMDAISVRDKNSAAIVKELTGKEPEINLDPVLMYEFADEVHEIPQNGYLAVYAYRGRFDEKEGQAIRAFARKKHLKMVAVSGVQDFCDEYVVADPFEIMSYMRGADYIVTDTFHGAVLAIKYGIPFAAIIRKSNYQKLSDLLERFNLQDRIVTDISDLEKVLTIDIKDKNPQIEKIIREEQVHATAYLKHFL